MKFRHTTWLVSLTLSTSMMVWAQNTDTQSQPQTDAQSQQQSDSSQQGPAPAPAFGQTAPILSPENPPISGIDEPRLDLRRALRSFVSVGLVADESANSNPTNQLGDNSSVHSVTHLLGALDLQRFWPKSDLIAEYVGGGAFYTSGIDQVRQLQDVGLMGVTRWRTGQLSVHDSFNYLPEGSFGAGKAPGLDVAEANGLGLVGGSIPGIHASTQFGSVGLISRITNTTIGSVVQSLSPRSAFTIVGSYGFSHFFEEQSILFNSQQLTTEAGYSYMLNRRDQVAGVYAFQEFHFPQSASGKIDAHVFYLRWGRTLSGRMSLVIGAGPQYVMIYQPGIPNVTLASESTHWSVAGRAMLHYKFQRSSISASYEKFTSAGSGIFAGTDTQVARFSVARPLSRTWELAGDLGYSHNKRLQFSFLTPSGFAGNYFDSGFAGVVVHKQISRNFGAFASYRFNELSLQVPSCIDNFGCGRTSQRHTASIGVDWHPRPVRIE
jgi:hypothetical protein